MSVISLIFGFPPVVLFLMGMLLMDSYKLVARNSVLWAMGVGGTAAAICYLANRVLLTSLHVPHGLLTLYLAPTLEEVVKAIYLIVLIRMHRVGFMVDAGIQGFAVGTGFAVIENLYYAGALGRTGVLVWLVRGLGTAVMHGSASAMVGIVSKNLFDRHEKGRWYLFLPGLAIAIAAHSTFNHLTRYPALATAFLLIVMPLLLFMVFEYSERATREWLGERMDVDLELLEQIMSGEVVETRVGRYLHLLKEHFPGPVVADMLCLVRINLELSTRAKGLLLAQAAGIEVPVDDAVRANFDEMKYLERAIGHTGRMAIMPFLPNSSRDLWQLYKLEKAKHD